MKNVDLSFDYDARGLDYAGYRQTDPRIANQILACLGEARTILNVGAGTGSYEPADRYVVAVEPSQTMRSQRVANGRTPAVNSIAEGLPFDDDSFDASMAVLTVHHWLNIGAGLSELRRVTHSRVVIVTYDPDALDVFWNVHYFREVVETERKRYPTITSVLNVLGGKGTVEPVAIPFDCIDGFQEAFYGRPEAFLDANVRKNQSAWGLVDAKTEKEMLGIFSKELASGDWDRKFGQHRSMPTFAGALRIVSADYSAGE